MYWEKIGRTIWRWTWRFIRIILLILALTVLHPALVGSVVYIGIMSIIWPDIWPSSAGMHPAELFHNIFIKHAIAAWVGAVLVLIFWATVWGFFGWQIHRFMKKNFNRLRGWYNGLIVIATREATTKSLTFEAETLLHDSLEHLLSERKLYQITKDENGNKKEKLIEYKNSVGRLGEDLITLFDYKNNNKWERLVFKLPSIEFEEVEKQYYRDVADYKIAMVEWRSHKSTRRPKKPLHPTELKDMKVFGKLNTRIYLKHDFDNLSKDIDKANDAYLFAKNQLLLLKIKKEHIKITLSTIKKSEIIDTANKLKKEVEEKNIIWIENKRIAKRNLKEARKINKINI